MRAATVQNSAPLHSTAEVTAWIPGSSRRRFAAAPPWNDEAEGLAPISEVCADFAETNGENPDCRQNGKLAARAFPRMFQAGLAFGHVVHRTIRPLFCWQTEHSVKHFIELYLALQNIDIRSSAAA